MSASVSRAEGFSRGARLWRYNTRILLGTGYWVLVLPVAASQIITLWMMALAGDFSQGAATRIAEQLTPILGAFLVAHSLAPEYRSGVGAVLACKPLSLHRVLTARVGLAMGFALLLTTVTLTVCSIGLKPIELAPPLLAAIPSLWFLSLLALTFATLFRNAFGGFAVAAAVWAVDYGLGYAVHPLLSPSGLTASLEQEPLAVLWLWSKGALIIAGMVLLAVHARLLPRICRAPEARDLPRMVAATVATVTAYCVSGALIMVGYAYFNRAQLPSPDVVWLQRQLRGYGPVPVAQFFGPAFATYVAPVPMSSTGSHRELRARQLEQAAGKWPKSIWADGILFALAAESESREPFKAVDNYLRTADRFSTSPFAPRALARVILMEQSEIPMAAKLQAARRLISDYAAQPEAEKGALWLQASTEASVDEKLRAAEAVVAVAPDFRRPAWRITAAELLAVRGDTARAMALAREVRTEALALQERARTDGSTSDLRPHLPEIAKAIQDADRLLAGESR